MDISLIAIGDRIENFTFRLFKAMLEAEGHTVSLLYLNIGRLPPDQALTPELLADVDRVTAATKLAGLYVFTFNFQLAARLTAHLKRRGVFVMWGGPHAIAEPEESAEHADLVCYNEGEEALLETVRRFSEQGSSFSREGIPNVAYRHGAAVRRNEYRRSAVSRDALPFQDYSLVRHYAVSKKGRLEPLTIEALKESSGGKLVYVTMVSRGCPFRCGFCINSSPNHIAYDRGRSVEHVIRELEEAKRRFGSDIDAVMFYDDDLFSQPKEFLQDLAAQYKARVGLPIRPVDATAIYFSEEKLEILKSAGIQGVIVGIQSISKNGKKVYGNPATPERIRKVVETMRKHPDLRLIFHLILGNPFEDAHDIAENFLFLDGLPKIYELSAYQLVIYPGTRLAEKVRSDPAHRHRAREGYTVPYYYSKPELALWNHLAHSYPGRKRDLPVLIRGVLAAGWPGLLDNPVGYGALRFWHLAREQGLGQTWQRARAKLTGGPAPAVHG